MHGLLSSLFALMYGCLKSAVFIRQNKINLDVTGCKTFVSCFYAFAPEMAMAGGIVCYVFGLTFRLFHSSECDISGTP